MNQPRKNTFRAPRALDPIRARRASALQAKGGVAGPGMAVNGSSQLEPRLGRAQYLDRQGFQQIRTGDGLVIRAGSPERLELDITAQIARATLELSRPTTEDVTDAAGDTLTTLLDRLRDSLVAQLPQKTSVDITFTVLDSDPSVVVTGLTWASSTRKYVAMFFPQAGQDPNEILGNQLTVTVGDIVDGVGFTVFAFSPQAVSGTFTVHVIGV